MDLTISWCFTVATIMLIWAWCYPARVGKWFADFKRGHAQRMAEPLKHEGVK